MVTVSADAPAWVGVLRPPRIRTYSPGGRVGGRRVGAVSFGATLDQLVIVEAITERPLGELRSAVVSDPEWVLNGIGGITFECDAADPTLLDCLVDTSTLDEGKAQLKCIGREAQWWRDGELRWAGPVVAGDVNMGKRTVRFEAFDHGWYLNRRFMGAAERRDLLAGIGSMDRSGLPGWTRVGGVAATRGTGDRVRGRGAAVLTGTGALTATFTHPTISQGQDGTVLVTAMVKLPASTPVGTEVLTVKAYKDGVESFPTLRNSFATQEDTPLGEWFRATAYCVMGVGADHEVTTTLWSASASQTRFDDVRALKNDTTGILPAADLCQHGVALMNHTQRGRGKTTFGFRVKVLSPAGTTESRGFRHLEHTQILDLFDQYVDREDGWDWWVNPQNRTVYFAARRGIDHTDRVLDDHSTLAGGWSHDESKVSSSVVVPGEGDGIDRPEGGYTDTSRTGGLLLEHYERPPNGTPLSALDPMAKAKWNELSQPQTSFSPVVVPADWWPDLSPGDRFKTYMECGVLRPAVPEGGFRVQKITHNLEADVLELV